ncbi:integration host factor subunit alpha [Parvularcula sp. LCG005]|uniref:integration host factor subunit alpha n=1 Tax=Parvularcula sp. LCG005 TaxID=3078805 RepID=UPI002942F1CD|nr:integration host factor subunit alpha [Parvularcula sp. LCG005]WOI54803.1 integration host factor subunit alpha [Parvularcula sp. LCG005]
METHMAKTRTRADLTDAVYQAVGLSRHESGQLVESVLNTIAQRLEQGETVKLSSFGTFQVRSKNERIGRNPKTGEEVAITPRRVLTFRASHVLKERINESMRGNTASAS